MQGEPQVPWVEVGLGAEIQMARDFFRDLVQAVLVSFLVPVLFSLLFRILSRFPNPPPCSCLGLVWLVFGG
jgi:hypothetical protein